MFGLRVTPEESYLRGSQLTYSSGCNTPGPRIRDTPFAPCTLQLTSVRYAHTAIIILISEW